MDKNKENVPKIRFPGFTGPWEQRKLSDIMFPRRILKQQSTEYPRLAFASGQGVIPLSERKTNNRDQLIANEFDKKYLITEQDDIVYNPANLKYGAIDRNKYGKGVISPIYVTFTTSVIPSFIERIVTTERFKSKALLFEEGTVVKRQLVRPENLLSFEEWISPYKKEQKLIGNFFDNLDNLITLHKRKLEHLQDQKKGLLQKMFPKDDEKFPELRFHGFTDPWEKRKLEDVTQTITKGTTPIDKNWIGPVNYIKTESIDKESGNLTRTSSTSLEEHEGFLKRSQLMTNDVLFSIVGTLGRVGLVQTKDLPANTNQQIAIIRLKGLNPYFVMNALKSPSTESFISCEATIGAQPSLSLWQINKLEINVPSIIEQEKIGNFFLDIDNLITLHLRKLEHLQQEKKGLLQQMLI